MLRNGTMPNVNHTGFQRIIHVGHSFGSAQTYALVALYPTISDGIVLTGFSMNASFVGYFAAGADFQLANLNQPLRFGSPGVIQGVNYLTQIYGLTDLVAGIESTPNASVPYANGYMTHSNVNALQYLFFLPPYFDTEILYYAERTKQPVTQGELFTLGSLPSMNNFAGPVLVMTGDGDLPYCGGNCTATGTSLPSIPAAVQMNFPNASAFEAYIQPRTGHGLVFGYNATAGFEYVASWLSGHGLAASG